MLTPRRPPPEDYYQNNCRVLIQFVLNRYQHLLNDTENRLLHSFLACSDDGQRLFARLLTRKSLLRLDQISYAEVSHLADAIDELIQAQLLRLNPPVPAVEVLNLLRKPEIIDLVPDAPRALKKAELVLLWLDGRAEQQIRHRVADLISWVSVAHPNLWSLVQLLYFGSRKHSWSSFVMRDLGMVTYEQVAMSAHQFASRKMLEQTLRYQKLSDLSHRLDEHPGMASELTELLLPAVSDRFLRRRRAKALLRIGQWHERSQAWDAAVEAYRHVEVHPARERMVRVLHKQGDTIGAQAYLEQIKAQPFSEEEAQFAQRFGHRQAGFQPPTTTLDITQVEGSVEQQALTLLLEPDGWGIHAENTLFNTLTGLLYWPLIFADVPGAFTNPFQYGPNDLYDDDFLQPREDLLVELESRLTDDTTFAEHLRRMATTKNGIANALVYWPLLGQVSVDDLLQAIPLDDLRKMCGFLIRHLAQRRAGMPDLLVVHGPKNYELVEVKGPTDQLQPGQRIWFKHLQRMSIPARVVKLKLVEPRI